MLGASVPRDRTARMVWRARDEAFEARAMLACPAVHDTGRRPDIGLMWAVGKDCPIALARLKLRKGPATLVLSWPVPRAESGHSMPGSRKTASDLNTFR